MSSLPSSGFRTLTIVDALRGRTFACTHPECGQTDMPFDDARVPDILNLYLKARGDEVNEKYPLNASELAADARCLQHPLGEVNMWPIRIIAEEMDAWVARNARNLQTRETQKTKLKPIPPRKRVGSPIRSILNSRQPIVEKPTPSYRHRKRPTDSVPYTGPKRYGITEPKPKAPENAKKANKGQDPRKHKKKQGQ